jgi:hypothetical protein
MDRRLKAFLLKDEFLSFTMIIAISVAFSLANPVFLSKVNL